MITPTQGEALAVIAELCELSPDVRLGQLLALWVSSGKTKPGDPCGTSMTSSCWRSSTITEPS